MRKNLKTGLTVPSGIYRLDLPGKSMDGWTVHLSRKRRVFQKYFSNLAHRGERGALAAAMRYRRRILREHPAISRAEYAGILRKNNTSGVPGVHRTPASARGARRGHWEAVWVPESGGKPKRVKFSVARYGEQRAKEMAIAARERALEEMTGPWQGGSRKEARTREQGARRAPAPLPDARIARVAVGEKRLTVTLRDARLVSVPLWLVPKLGKASAAARQALRIPADGRAIEWPALRLRFVLKELLAEKF